MILRINAQVYNVEKSLQGKVIQVTVPLRDFRLTKSGKDFCQLTGEYVAEIVTERPRK